MKPDRQIRTAPALLTGLGALSLALVLLVPPGSALGGSLPRIVDLRVGEHAGFDRLVIQLDREASVSWHFDGTDVVVEIGARARRSARALSGSQDRMGSLRMISGGAGATLRVRAETRRIRAFRLSGPPRLVIDFGDPTSAPFPVAAGLIAIPESPPKPAIAEAVPKSEVAEATGGAPEAPAVELLRPAPAPPAPTPSPTLSGEPESETDALGPPGSPIPPAGPLLAAEAGSAEAPAPALGPAPPTGLPDSEAAEGEAEPGLPESVAVLDLSQEPPRERSTLHPVAAWLERFGGIDRLWVALWFGLPFLAAAGMIWMASYRRRGPRASGATQADPGEMSADELLDAAERIDLLEMRIDEEVRGRMKLEERTTELQEDVKVLKDRLLRIVRRDGSLSR